MREIKFRHFDTNFNEMRYSDRHDGEFYINTKGCLYFYTDRKTKKDYKSYDVMQFTGLLDKNRNEIFEGDIVKSHVDNRYLNGVKIPIYRNYVVEYIIKEQGIYSNSGFKIKPLSDVPAYLEIGDKQMEVIGNIHQNSELL